MPEAGATLLTRHLHDGAPFSVLQLATGGYRLTRLRQQTDFETFPSLLRALAEPERAMLPEGVVLSGLADRFDAVCAALETRPGAARELALDALVELLAVAPQVEPQIRPRAGLRWLRGAFDAVRELLVQGHRREAAVVASEAVQGLADLRRPRDRTLLEGEPGRERCVLDGAYWPEDAADLAAAVQAARELPALTQVEEVGTPQAPAFRFPQQGQGWSRVDLGMELERNGVTLSCLPVPPVDEAGGPTGRVHVGVASLITRSQRLQQMVELGAPDLILGPARDLLRKAVDQLLDLTHPELGYHQEPPASLRPLAIDPQQPQGPGAQGVLFLPHASTLVVQHRDGIAIVDLEAGVQATWPACPWPVAYGDREHAVFMGRPQVRDGVVRGVAVLHVPSGRWLDAWPDGLPAHFVEDTDEGPFFLDPRTCSSRPLPAGRHAWSAGGGHLVLADGPGVAVLDLASGAPHQVDAEPPGYLLHLDRGAVETDGEGLASTPGGPIAVGLGPYRMLRIGLPDGVVMSEQGVMHGVVGAFDAVGFEHCGRCAAYLCAEQVTVVELRNGEDGGPEVLHRFTLPSFS